MINSYKETLRSWQLTELQKLRKINFKTSKHFAEISAVVYFFTEAGDADIYFPYTECAVLETWRHCGLLKTIFVSNIKSRVLTSFANKWATVTEIQIEPSLTPGNIESLSIDCISKLGSRFKTQYMLTIQDDGFPIRPGLSRFLKGWDFIGTPYRRPNLLGLAAGYLHTHWPANGGFSLRSKKFCDFVTKTWNSEKYFTLSEKLRSEDIYCTDWLPRNNRTFAHQMHWANSYVASKFSFDNSFPWTINQRPFGFHNAKAFSELLQRDLVQSL